MAFRDGLGERRVTKDASGAGVEVLSLRREIAAVPSFEFALRERVTRLNAFRHAYYGHVRGIERSPEFDHALTVLSDATSGIRLSALLDTAHEQRLPVSLDVSLSLIRQLVPAVAILHETARDASHGAIGPERLIVTPNGRLVIVEYVLGSALEQLLFTRERYWTELRVALPRVAGLPKFDHLADVTQIGVVALSLILGRTLRDEEYPARIGEVVASATATNDKGETRPLPALLRTWLQRALQLDARNSFPSAIEARAEFERVLADSGSDASPEHLDTFLARYHAHHPPAPPAANTSKPPSVEIAAVPTPAVVPVVTVAPSAAISVAASKPSPVVAVPMAPVEPKPAAKDALKEPVKDFVKEPASPDKPLFSADAVEPTRVIPPRRRSGGRITTVAAAVAVGVVILGGGALVGAKRFLADEPAPSPTGTLVVTTNPAGAEAFVDGVRRGNTPLTVQVLAGSHRVELRGKGEPRTIPITIAPGQQVAQYVDLPVVVPPAVEQRVEATTDAPAAADRSEVERSVAASAPGWIAVNGKVEVQIFEGGHLLGTSKVERIMVPAGRHDLELVNELLGFRGTRTVQVVPGKLSAVGIDLPKGTMAINALPWAEVWMDGAKIGETPIGNFAITAGSHDVVFRHPELGEQRETVLVTLKAPVRLSVDMRKP